MNQFTLYCENTRADEPAYGCVPVLINQEPPSEMATEATVSPFFSASAIWITRSFGHFLGVKGAVNVNDRGNHKMTEYRQVVGFVAIGNPSIVVWVKCKYHVEAFVPAKSNPMELGEVTAKTKGVTAAFNYLDVK